MCFYALISVWKIQKMVKRSCVSVKNMRLQCDKFQTKFGLNWELPWGAMAKTCSLVFCSAICPLDIIYKAICGPKKIHPVCQSFDLLRLQMITIAQNDQNCLRILNRAKKNFTWKWIDYSCPSPNQNTCS